MSQLSKQLSFDLKEAGFSQPEPEFGQMWWHPDGGLHVVITTKGLHTFTRYLKNGWPETGAFNKQAMEEMAFAPNSVDILAEMPYGTHIKQNQDTLWYVWFMVGFVRNYKYDENPRNAAAKAYLALKEAEAK